MGYKATAGLFSAQEVGSTHQRKRTYILGLRPHIMSDSIQIEEPPQWLYPNFREAEQFIYEPFRIIMDDSNSSGFSRDTNESSDTEPQRRQNEVGYIASSNTSYSQLLGSSQSEMGGDVDGSSYRLGDAQCYKYFDNRRDEMRLLGNGVVPQTVALAFKTLFNKLTVNKK